MGVVVTKDGESFEVSEDEAARLVRTQGFTVEGVDARADRVGSEAREEFYSTPGAKVTTGIVTAGSMVTGGLSDALASSWGLSDDVKALRETNPGAAAVGQVGGALSGVGLAGLATRTGAGVARTAEGASALTQIGRAAGGAAVEGAIMGAGEGVSQLALSADPLTLERTVAAIGSNAFFGGSVGGGVGLLAKGAAVGARAAGGKLDDLAAAGAPIDDSAAKLSLADDIAAHRQALQDEKVWLATKGATERELKEVGKISLEADKALDRILRNPKALAQDPKKALSALQQQEHALERLAAKSDDVRGAAKAERVIPATADEVQEGVEMVVPAKLFKERGYLQSDAGLGDKVRIKKARQAIREGQREAIEVAVTPAGRLEIVGGRHRLDAAIALKKPIKVKFSAGTGAIDELDEAGELLGRQRIGDGGLGGGGRSAREAALDKLPAALERNRLLQQRIAEDLAPNTAAQAGGLGSSMLGGQAFSLAAGIAGAIPGIGPMLAPIAGGLASKLVTGGLTNLSAKQAARASAAVKAFANVADKGAKTLPPLATRALAAVSYGDKKRAANDNLAGLYTARATELKQLTQFDPSGRAVMRPDARAKIADKLAPTRQVSPQIADQLETIQARKIEALANRLPRKPDVMALRTGPDKWQPSDMEMRSYARFVSAVEDPSGVFDRVAGGIVTPEDVQAMKQVYPEMYADFQRQVIGSLASLRKTLPYNKRLALSIFSEQPVDPALDPKVLTAIQAAFAAEAAPTMPSPQFGSVKNHDATPSQERQGLTA